ncbi:MAG: M50 family metallopeptidase [Alicyclobacillaceae bacterium]|jgi:stage IV sporulation protein FB|nr:M50 family metallopeptidase [Alicyclobacillaceae bacterium]MCY0896340.1 M50 family metallopeptidase [Alicyclobacillaceae bacterium]
MTSLVLLRKRMTQWRYSAHPLFVLLMIAAAIVGLLPQALLLFVVVFLHEMGHAVAAELHGCKVKKVTLLPFGGVAELEYGAMGFRPRVEASIAVAGPAVNLLLIGISVLLSGNIHLIEFARELFDLNLWILLFNLLPALPLDGGRILRAIRSREIGYELATREAFRMAFWASGAALLLGLASLATGRPHLGALMLGVFLLLSALGGRRRVRVETMQFLTQRTALTQARNHPVLSLAVSKDSLLRDVAIRCSPDRYILLYVLDTDGRVMGIIDESEVLQAAFRGDWLLRVGDLLRQLT